MISSTYAADEEYLYRTFGHIAEEAHEADVRKYCRVLELEPTERYGTAAKV